ncbi:MAG: hypothetical protein N3F64_06485 [Nitrososphaeria archaeon]|nr:hypothetical protein [Nitrososphaeria archaeon]
MNIENRCLREEKANTIIEIDELTKKAAEKVKEIGIFNPFLHKEIVSYCNSIGGKIKVSENLEEVFGKLKENLRMLINDLGRFKEHKFS